MNFKLNKSNLNLNVYTAPTLPSSGTENDVVILSSVPMKNWMLSPGVPKGAPRADGDVWLQYSVDGDTFNALKNAALVIAVSSAYQYINGEWLKTDMRIYQDGAWVECATYLFNNGDTCEDITGGWTSSGWQYYSNQSGLNNAEIDDTIRLYGSSTTSGSKCGILSTVNMIDLTDVSTIYVHNVATTSGGNTLFLMSSKTYIQGKHAAKLDLLASSNGTDVALDVSSMTGKYYVVLSSVGSTNYPNPSLEVSKVWLEK